MDSSLIKMRSRLKAGMTMESVEVHILAIKLYKEVVEYKVQNPEVVIPAKP